MGIGYAAVNFVPIRPVGAFALVPCRPHRSRHPQLSIYHASEASVLIDVFDLSTSNATDGDITVCVDTEVPTCSA